MLIVTKKQADDWAAQHPPVAASLANLVAVLEQANWKNPVELTKTVAKASIITSGSTRLTRVIFNLSGGYRVVTHIDFKLGVVYMKWFGNHKDYEKRDWSTHDLGSP